MVNHSSVTSPASQRALLSSLHHHQWFSTCSSRAHRQWPLTPETPAMRLNSKTLSACVVIWIYLNRVSIKTWHHQHHDITHAAVSTGLSDAPTGSRRVKKGIKRKQSLCHRGVSHSKPRQPIRTSQLNIPQPKQISCHLCAAPIQEAWRRWGRWCCESEACSSHRFQLLCGSSYSRVTGWREASSGFK